MAIGLQFSSAIELLAYRIWYCRIQGTIEISDIGSKPQSIGLSDIGLRKKLSVAHLCFNPVNLQLAICGLGQQGKLRIAI
jgi:hypothetical protein